MLRIAILPIGQVNTEVLQFVQHGLNEAFFEVEVSILQTEMSIYGKALDLSRQQYRSALILAQMSKHFGNVEAQCVLGVTAVDLYATGLNFVFGEAQCPGKFALISLFRLKPEFYGKPANSDLFLERALKEAVHEVGHTNGLGHCSNPLCVMYFSNSIVDTDRKQAKFCEDCHLLVHRVLEE